MNDMDNLFKEMREKGLIEVNYEKAFENQFYISPQQEISWKYFDGKSALVTKMKLQHAILPSFINKYSRN